MSPDTIIQLDIGTVFTLLGVVIMVLLIGPLAWIVKGLLSDLSALKEQHNGFEKEVNKEFVRKADYVNNLNEIKQMLRDISDKLDGKADKP